MSPMKKIPRRNRWRRAPDQSLCSLRRFSGGRIPVLRAASWRKNRSSQTKNPNEEYEKMAAYARIYGFQVVDGKHIEGREEEFTCLGGNCYLSNGEYEMLEEILEKEF